jgi:dipeptidyl aminopeptidase/acylaminoacyl peptidase
VLFGAESGTLPLDLWAARLTPEGQLRERRRVTHANPWLDSLASAEALIYRYHSAAGDTLEAQLFLPPASMLRRGSLPLVLIPYGLYLNEFPTGEYFLERGIQPLTTIGYAVIRPNTRESVRLATHHYGEAELEDTLQLLDALTADGLVDPSRVALIGHSHGGAMVYSYLTHSDRFCTGIAVNGAADWVFQSRLQGMVGLPGAMSGTPDEVPAEYEAASPLANATRLRVPLLAVAGAADSQVPPQNAISMVEALRLLGKPAELLYFEDEGHLIEREENIRRFWARVFQFLASSCE